MNQMKKVVLYLISCLMMTVLTACSGERDAKAMRKNAEDALPKMLSEYYGLEADSYTYKLFEMNNVSGPDCGVIWAVTTKQDLDGNGDLEFLVFMSGTETTEYTSENVYSDRYSALYVKKLREDIERRLQIVGAFQDLSYKVVVHFRENDHFGNYSNILPINVKPDDYETYMKELQMSTMSGIAVDVQVFSDEPITVTKALLQPLVEQSMSDMPIKALYVSRYTDRDRAARDIYEESYMYYYAWSYQWEFEQLPAQTSQPVYETEKQ